MLSHNRNRSRRRTIAAALLGTAIAVTSLLTPANAQASLTLGTNIAAAGTSVSHVLSPSYFGIGIEPSNLFAFLGTTSPNQFSLTLLNNLANYTGQPIHVRIGGNTLDTAVYNSSYNGYYFQDNPDTTGPTDVSYFGPNFFKVINYLPKNTPVTYSIGLAYQGSDAESNAMQVAQGVVSALTNVKLNGLEIGNEPDLYVQNQFRSSGWAASQYGTEWITRAQNIYNSVLKPAGISQTFFESACTATTAANRGFRIEDLVGTGVATDNGVWLAGWNQHDYYYYVGVSTYTLTIEALMNLATTSGQFTEWKNQVGQANVTGKPYYLREMGSVGPAGLDGISNTFANALWTINFLLYAATIGVQSVQLHVLQESYSAPWHPVKSSEGGLFIRPTYYAYAAMAQIIGAGCQTQVAGLTMDNLSGAYSNHIGAYSVYDAGSLQSIVVINSNPLYTGSGSSSEQVTFTLDAGMAGKTFYLSVMTAAGVDSTSGVTWNGMSYESSGTGSASAASSASGNTIQQVQVGTGNQLTFSVRDSQMVVANLGSQLGTTNNVVDAKACGTLAVAQSNGGSGNDGDNTFKATSGFASDMPLSLGAIIGIAAGGGAAILILLIFCIVCCVRRSRKKRRMRAADTAALLKSDMRANKGGHNGRQVMGGYSGQRNAYRSVPLHDGHSRDSSEDIFMANMGRPRTHTHTPRDSYSSYPASLTNSPMIPGTPRQTYEGHGYTNERGNSGPREMASVIPTPPPQSHASPVYGQARQGSNLNPQQGRNISAHTTAAAAGLGAGAGAMLARQQQQPYQQSPQQQQQMREWRQPGPSGPRGPPPTQYPRERRNSYSGRRDQSPAPGASRPTAHSAHGHGPSEHLRYSDQPPMPALPPGYGGAFPAQELPQSPQRGPPPSGARLGRPIRLSQDGRGDAAQRRGPSQSRPASHQGH